VKFPAGESKIVQDQTPEYFVSLGVALLYVTVRDLDQK
jgi:hypothetical protein